MATEKKKSTGKPRPQQEKGDRKDKKKESGAGRGERAGQGSKARGGS